MKNNFKGWPAATALSLCSTLFLLFRFAKVSPIVGSYFSFFSLSDVVMPLTGNLGFGFVGFIVALRFLVKSLFVTTPLTALVYYIPGISASAYWATENKVISLLIPAACMVAFLAHPVGFAAAPYSFYWFIPMALYFMPRKTIFMHSLASTFVAHAVGTVIWLYANPMAPALWYGLIPVVAVERLVFAGLMTAVYHVGVYLKEKLFGSAVVGVTFIKGA